MLYPPQFIERLRSHFLLSELIGRRVALKKNGREYGGLCPFHNEKTPSFTVNNEKGFFHCFGCAAHGDAIEFVKRYENISWREAIEKLARDAGMALPVASREEVEREQASNALITVMEAAAAWFESNLAAPEHMAARDYAAKRALSDETRKTFRIGYAPEAREGLKRHLLAKGFSEAHAVECGLLIQPESGPSYDRFRSRLMFPIRSRRGQVIAFGGRLMGDAQGLRHAPKYLNSPETPLFHKGEVLFNFDRAGERLDNSDTIVIVEGYMDAISLAQAGFSHTVATLGTAVTAEHLRRLWQRAPYPILCLDGDAAGQRAMLRAAELALPLLTPEHSLRFAVLPDKEDPDSYVRKAGAEGFKSLLKQSEKTGTLSQVLWNHLHQSHDTASAEGLAALENACGQMLQKISDATVRKSYKNDFDGHIRGLRDLLWKQKRARPQNEQPRAPQVVQMATGANAARFDALLLQVFHLLSKFPALAHTPQLDETLSSLDIRDQRLEGIRHSLLEALHSGDDDESHIATLCAGLPEDMPLPRSPDAESAARTLAKLLKTCEIGLLQIEDEDLGKKLEREWDEAIMAQRRAVRERTNQLKEQVNALSGAVEEE